MKLLMQEILRSAVFGSAVPALSIRRDEGATGPVAGGAGTSVIISTPREAKNTRRDLPDLPMDRIDEVILVEGRSSEEVAAFARKILPEIEIVTVENGAGEAGVKVGYAAATGEILVFLDADRFGDPRKIPQFVTAIRESVGPAKGG